MATVKSTLALNDKMSSTFSSITRAMRSTLTAMEKVNASTSSTSTAMKKAHSDITKAEQSLKSYSNSANKATSASNSFFKSIMAASAVQWVIRSITAQLDSAITRLDTINNFPKVMSNLGIGALESEAAIDKLSDKLTGLPTALDTAASSVQRFTSSNGDINKSTDMFLALNNAILAGGASSAIQSTALEQLSQAYAKGKPDMMEWKSAMTAMPAQLAQVAKAMGYVNSAELGEALRTGKVSMDSFMNKIMEMNTKGVNGFKSFEEQAKNATGGLRTAITNMKTAITRGLTNAMESINETLTKSGLPDIQTIVAKIGSTIEWVLTSSTKQFSRAMKVLQPIINLIKTIYNFIKDNWSIIEPILYGIVVALLVYKAATNSVKLATMALSAGIKIWTAVQTALNAVLAMNPIMLIVLGIILLISLIYAVVAAINKITGSSLNATQLILGALATAGAFIWNLFLGILDIALMVINFLWNRWATFANFFANLFNDPVASIINLFAGMADSVLGILEGIASAIDKIFGSNLAGAVSGWRSKVSGAANSLVSKYGNGSYEEKYGKINLTSESLGLNRISYGSAFNTGKAAGAGLEKSISKFFNGEDSALGKASESTAGLNKNISDSMGTDKSGGKAVKTTTNDDLLSDEDIQLLLDIATRDYKLSYQQITPNVTITFGDVNETADVDMVMEAVADKLQEIYDSDLEV